MDLCSQCSQTRFNTVRAAQNLACLEFTTVSVAPLVGYTIYSVEQVASAFDFKLPATAQTDTQVPRGTEEELLIAELLEKTYHPPPLLKYRTVIAIHLGNFFQKSISLIYIYRSK